MAEYIIAYGDRGTTGTYVTNGGKGGVCNKQAIRA